MRFLKKTKTFLRLPFYFFTVTVALTACQKSFDSIDEYEQYVKGKDSPYRVSKSEGEIQLDLLYLPPDALMISSYRAFEKEKRQIFSDRSMSEQEKKNIIEEKRDKLTAKRKLYENSMLFTLTIGYLDLSKDIIYHKIQEGFNYYSEWLQTLLFSMEKRIYLKTSNGLEIPLNSYHMERNYGLAKSRTFLLSFPAEFNRVKIKEEKLTLVIKEFGLKIGTIKIKMETPFKEMQIKI
jgi:hypothetical protein